MACCTTIPPLNSTGQKRSSGGIFDLPKSAKRRRPFGSTSVTTVNAPLIASALATNASSSPTKLLTNSIFSNLNISNGPSSSLSSTSHVIIDATDENNKKRSAFQANNSPFGSSTANTHQQFEFKSELMERIKHEAKRLIKRKQASNLSTVNTGSTSSNSTDEDESTLTTASPSSSSSSSSLTQTTSSLSSHVNDNLLACNSKLTSVSSSNLILIPNATSITKTTTTTTTPNTLKRSNEAMNINNNRLNLAVTNHNDLPLFSMNQVNQICSGMIREREQLIREQYDKILAEKLSEQYDSFVKFTHEQIQRRFEKSQCSYVS